MNHHHRIKPYAAVGAACLALWSPALAAAQDEDTVQVKDVAAELRRTQEKIAGIQEAKKNLPAAFKIYKELLGQEPGDEKYQAQVCRLAGELKQYGLSLKLAKELVKRKPKVLNYRLWLARALMMNKKTGEAAVHWQWIAKRSPNNPESRQELAFTYEALKEPAKALVHYDWLIARSPRNVEFRLARFHLLGDLKRGKAQHAALSALLRLAPKDPVVLMEAGDFHLGEDRADEAEVLFKRVVKLVPAAPRPAPLRARALAGMVKINKAREARLREALEAFREAERLNDWQNDIWERGEDF